jgi:uncharacterized membrane protein
MSFKQFKIIRIFIAMFIAATVSTAVSINNIYLATSAVIIGIISMLLIKRSVKDVMVDEMVQNIAQKSAWITYSICIPLLALVSLILMFSDLQNQGFLYQLGSILSYIVLFSMFVYSFAYYFYKKKYGRDDE